MIGVTGGQAMAITTIRCTAMTPASAGMILRRRPSNARQSERILAIALFLMWKWLAMRFEDHVLHIPGPVH